MITNYIRISGATGLTSGHCHLGGIDIWAEQAADRQILEPFIYEPATLAWMSGFMPRNIKIARKCDLLLNIVVDKLPPAFAGMTFEGCYHCVKREPDQYDTHVKSGGCWTMWYAKEKFKKKIQRVIVEN